MLDTSCFWMNNAAFALKCIYCTPYHSLPNSSFCFTASIWIRISKAQPKAEARVVLHPSLNNKNKAVSLSPIIIVPTIPLHLITLCSPPPCLLCPPFCISNSFFHVILPEQHHHNKHKPLPLLSPPKASLYHSSTPPSPLIHKADPSPSWREKGGRKVRSHKQRRETGEGESDT